MWLTMSEGFIVSKLSHPDGILIAWNGARVIAGVSILYSSSIFAICRDYARAVNVSDMNLSNCQDVPFIRSGIPRPRSRHSPTKSSITKSKPTIMIKKRRKS